MEEQIKMIKAEKQRLENRLFASTIEDEESRMILLSRINTLDWVLNILEK